MAIPDQYSPIISLQIGLEDLHETRRKHIDILEYLPSTHNIRSICWYLILFPTTHSLTDKILKGHHRGRISIETSCAPEP